MNETKIRIGFVPTYRWTLTPWCRKMREDSLAALAQVEGIEVIVPQASPDGKTLDASRGLVPDGSVVNLDQAEAVAEFFAARKVDALVICPLDFGDERSAAKVAEILRAPVFLYATKEPPAAADASLARLSDSYCGTLAVAAALRRRKIAFHYAGLFLPDEPALREAIQPFVAAVAVAKGLRGARIGQVGVRPPPFESVAYDELAMVEKFGQNIIYTAFSDLDEAARSVGITPKTLLRWQQQPEFQKAYREARRAAFGQAIARLQQGTSAAATTLLKTLIDPATSASVKVRAAEAIFNHAAKAIEIEDIDARVTALEQAAETQKSDARR